MLYPLIFKPILKSIIWGGNEICIFKDITPRQEGIGESWEISSVKDNISVVANGKLKDKSLEELINTYKEKLVGKKVFERFGSTFPLLIKFIDAKQALSIQVHPDDELAQKRHNSFGKTEMWYVINATKGAHLYSGFSKQMTPDTYVQSLKDDTLTDYLDKHEVSAGDVFFLPAGRVHAIGAGCFIAEIQQTSDITYRLYDYNRKDAQGNPRELHTELGKDAIDYHIYPDHKLKYQPAPDKAQPLVSCQYFTTNLIEGKKEIKRDLKSIDSFVIYICMEGNLILKDDNGFELPLKQGRTVLVPAECESILLSPEGNYKMLETYIMPL